MTDLLVIRSRFEDRLRRINADLPIGAAEIEGGDSVRLANQARDALRRLDEP